MTTALRWGLVLALVAGMGCAGARARPADAPSGTRVRIISSQTVEQSGARTMWDAIRLNVKHVWFTENGRGDPERIRTRGASTVELMEDMRILVDGVLLTNLRVLDGTPARDIQEIRVLSGIDATTYYGTLASDGVILIRTKGRRPGG